MSEDQNVHKCDICAEESSLNWRCLECYEVLCHRCKMVHLRGKATKGHHLMNMVHQPHGAQKQRCKSLPPSCVQENIPKIITTCPDNELPGTGSNTDSSDNTQGSDKKPAKKEHREETRLSRARFKPVLCNEPKQTRNPNRIYRIENEIQKETSSSCHSTPRKTRSSANLSSMHDQHGKEIGGSKTRSRSLPRCNLVNGNKAFNIAWKDENTSQPRTLRSSSSCLESVRSVARNMNYDYVKDEKEKQISNIKESPRRAKQTSEKSPKLSPRNNSENVLYNDINQSFTDDEPNGRLVEPPKQFSPEVRSRSSSNNRVNRVAFLDQEQLKDQSRQEQKHDMSPRRQRKLKPTKTEDVNQSPKHLQLPAVSYSRRPKSLSVTNNDREQLRCRNHPSEKLRMFCKDCKFLICEECVETGCHKSHDLVKMSTIAGKKREQLAAHTDSLKDLLDTVSDAVLANGKYVRTFKVLKSQMSKITKTSDEKIARFSYFNAKFVNAWLEIQERITKSEEVLNSKESVLIENSDTIITDNVNIQTTVQDTIEQWRDAISEKKGEESSAIKNISEESDLCCSRHNSNTQTDVLLKKRLILNYDVGTIMTLERGVFLTSEVFQNDIFKVYTDGTCKSFLMVERNIISGMADYGKDGVLVACYSSQCVLLKSKDSSEQREIIVTKPLYPRGVCTMHLGTIAVCVIDKIGNTATKSSVRAVHVYSEKGKLVRKIQFDESGKRYFISPRKVQENYNGDLCVLDQTLYTSGCLVAVDKNGYHKYSYHGDVKDKSLRPFNPTDLTCTRASDVLIADFNNDRIYILCSEGHCINVLDTKYHGIFLPFAIDVDVDDIIWLGARNEIYAMEIVNEQTQESAVGVKSNGKT